VHIPHFLAEQEDIMTNTVHEFVESLVAATVNNEVKWNEGSEQLVNVLEEVYGNSDQVYSFLDEEASAHVVVATYQYYAGEEQVEDNIENGTSILLVDTDDFEILNEVTDEDIDDAALLDSLMEAIETAK
jgi:predicted nucleotide-binding protein (sugar kinase/HSP70/actin superfamily)